MNQDIVPAKDLTEHLACAECSITGVKEVSTGHILNSRWGYELASLPQQGRGQDPGPAELSVWGLKLIRVCTELAS